MTAAQALALTLACEVPLILWLTARLPHLSRTRVALVAATASCVTHPLAWRAALAFTPDMYRTGLWLIEAIVVVIEALWYLLWLRPGWRRAATWSLAANALSATLGMLAWKLI